MMNDSIVTVVVPSFNQGEFLAECLESILTQGVQTEIVVMDGGSTDSSLDVIRKYSDRIAYWQSKPDGGQSAAINAGRKIGTGEFCCWLNSDDLLLPGALERLRSALVKNPQAPVAYGRVRNLDQASGRFSHVWVEPFSVRRLAVRCLVSQPGTLFRRTCWQQVGGLNANLKMSMDYDLWWRLHLEFGDFEYLHEDVAVNRDHDRTKTNTNRSLHYKESMAIVRKYYGRTPLKWYLYQPYAVWFRSLKAKLLEK